MVKPNWGSGVSGAISGGVTGSSAGVPGAIIGAVTGGLTGLFGSGKKKKKKKLSTLDPLQQQLNESEFEALHNNKGPLADLYNYNPEQANKVFDETIARYANRDFAENKVPQITGQFRSNSLQNSSYTGEALSRAGRDVQESLNAQRNQYLYGLESQNRAAKRNAIENFQNRTTFDYEKKDPAAGFDFNSLSKYATPENFEKLMSFLGGK